MYTQCIQRILVYTALTPMNYHNLPLGKPATTCMGACKSKEVTSYLQHRPGVTQHHYTSVSLHLMIQQETSVQQKSMQQRLCPMLNHNTMWESLSKSLRIAQVISLLLFRKVSLPLQETEIHKQKKRKTNANLLNSDNI